MKLVAWFFILQVGITAIIPKTDVGQLRLIGNLYSHFEEFHAEEYQGSKLLNFIYFIEEHYVNVQHDHQHDHEHEQLPFKDFTSGVYFSLINQEFFTTFYNYYTSNYKIIGVFLYPKGYKSAIDRPPSV